MDALNADLKLRDKLGDEFKDFKTEQSDLDASDKKDKGNEMDNLEYDQEKKDGANMFREPGEDTMQHLASNWETPDIKTDNKGTPRDRTVPKDNNTLQQSDNTPSKSILVKSPKAHSTEIEDEQNIRIESPDNKREMTSIEAPQEESKFDSNDMSFFDMPVNKPSDLHMYHEGREMKAGENREKTNESFGTPQGPIADLSAKENHIEKETDKHIDQIQDKVENLAHNGLNNSTDVKSSDGDSNDKNDNMIHVSEIKDNTSDIREKKGEPESLKSERKPESPNNVNDMLKVNQYELQNKNIELHDGMTKLGKDKRKQTVVINSRSTYGSYEADFEDDSTVDREKSQSNLKIPLDEGFDRDSGRHSPKHAEPVKENEDLLIEELTNVDLFERNRPKSSMNQNKTHTETKASNDVAKTPDEQNDGEGLQLSIERRGSINDRIDTVLHGQSVEDETEKPSISNEHVLKKGERDNEIFHMDTRGSVQSTNNEDTRGNEETGNPFFTGRLPTLAGPGNEDQNDSKEKDRTDKSNFGVKDVLEKKPKKIEPLDDLKRKDCPNDTDIDTRNDTDGVQTKHTNKEAEPDALSENRSTSRIIELIQEINAPAQKFQMTKERPLTPKTPSDKHQQPSDDGGEDIVPGTRLTDSFRNDEHRDGKKTDKQGEEPDMFQVENKHMKVGDLDQLTTSVMNQYARDEASPASKFDKLPHIHQISQYNRDNKLAGVPGEKMEDSQTNDESGRTHFPSIHPQPALKPVHSRETSNHSGFQTNESTTVVGNHYQEYKTSDADDRETLDHNKRSSSESDLKAVVASAKRVYRGQEVSSSSSILPPISPEGRTESERSKVNQTRSSFKTTKTSDESGGHVLICSSCLQQDGKIDSAGFCRECQQYLCGNCIKQHKDSRETKRHDIMVAYCAKELEVKKYVKATGYCMDCQHFLCMKCVIQHTGFRANRYHRIIQSSFISKPDTKSPRKPKQEVSVSFPQNTKASDGEMSDREIKTSRNRKKILKDLDKGNPYRMNKASVPESLYPGPNKKIGVSYAENPKWPQASVPKLPYLLKPKTLQERVFQTPYVAYQKSAFFTHPKSAFSPNKVKLKTLQARYASTGQPKRTSRRRDEQLFTARRGNISEGTSLPDIHHKQTTTPRTRNNEKPSIPRPSGLKKAKLLKEYCISVPFPSGERKSDILAMACLPNGNVLVADKQNNNVKLYNRQFKFKALVQFNNRLVDICSSNLCPVDLYVATQKHVFEITTMRRGLEVQKKIRVDIQRIEGLTCWKYGLAVIHKKSNLTWELRLMDYRGNSKSKLEIVNPFTQEIDAGPVCYITTIKGGKRIILTDAKNACMICTDVTSRCVLYETTLPDDCPPSYVTSDNQHNVFVSCPDKIQQLSKEGNNVGTIIARPDGVKSFGCILYNRTSELLYIQTAQDCVSVYQMM